MPPAKPAAEIIWNGNDDLRPLLVPIAELHEDPGNANTHPERSLAAIASSYARFGQAKPLVCDRANVVRAGNGQLAAAKRLGWSHVAVSKSSLSGPDLMAFAIADNKTADFAEFDAEVLAAQLEAIRSEEDGDGMLAATGFTEGDLAGLLESLAAERAGPDEVIDLDADASDATPGDGGGFAQASESQVRMVQLFLDATNIDEFHDAVEKLNAEYQTANATDAVMECLRRAVAAL